MKSFILIRSHHVHYFLSAKLYIHTYLVVLNATMCLQKVMLSHLRIILYIFSFISTELNNSEKRS